MEPTGSALNPVFVGLRIGLHALVAGLVALCVVSSLAAGSPSAAIIAGLAALFLGTYAVGAWVGRSRTASRWAGARLGLLSLEWVVLAGLNAEAIYLVFPLFFLFLHFLPGWCGPVAVAVATVAAVFAVGAHRGFSPAGAVGPLIGAALAVAIALAYRSLAREAAEREDLIRELRETRGQLAAAERTAGVQGERGRLAREIHDTVSQSLSSIVMLLHAAERSGDAETSLQRMRQARDAAGQTLAETRQFIDELSPPALRGSTLVEALHRLATQTGATSGIRIGVTVAGPVEPLPTRVETALWRIAQGALANAVQHAHASRIDLTLSALDSEVILDVVDDGVGFDAGASVRRGDTSTRTSFGLQAMRERVAELGGSLTVESAPGQGTSVVAGFEVRG
ncbi:sensor histidine kinase [Cryobacterium sp. TMT1-21]|uniref:Sensor histidine kinase n=1 Tax=Cryobacterium shii TaxID=1259235 RepID=A0AAQ2HGG7_9MICO|nr:sensor histidine kinase [Cryobacterium shii]TFC80951.1 sensor histidine kinase [Cryobacterium sp. TmT2-59]TFD11394.1 sensor histidine kinase [Cryobacterium sp. TMT1-21]TFD18822.1 sensor histidine kinase [Cryobacterium sp. TMT2-23]TFD18887.1 sensor histidine kinase [Cryobacterium sp. TMT4-10]TFD40692.1 sensor histidine kinase [Cryobacterium sp. TMT2-10]